MVQIYPCSGANVRCIMGISAATVVLDWDPAEIYFERASRSDSPQSSGAYGDIHSPQWMSPFFMPGQAWGRWLRACTRGGRSCAFGADGAPCGAGLAACGADVAVHRVPEGVGFPQIADYRQGPPASI